MNLPERDPVSPGENTDPTANVIAILEAAVKRQDDLRSLEAQCLRETIDLRADYDEKLRVSESARIDAIRAVDQGNVTRASEVAAAQATALAAQLQVSAEALRAQVEATRITTADTLAAALSPIQNDVAVLREVQFRQQGEKSQQVDTVGAEVAAQAAKTARLAVTVAGVAGSGTFITLMVGIATHGRF